MSTMHEYLYKAQNEERKITVLFPYAFIFELIVLIVKNKTSYLTKVTKYNSPNEPSCA